MGEKIAYVLAYISAPQTYCNYGAFPLWHSVTAAVPPTWIT